MDTRRTVLGSSFAVGLMPAVLISALVSAFLPGGRAAAQTAVPQAPVSATSRAITAVVLQPLRFDALGSAGDGKSGFISRGSGYAMVLTPGSAVVSLTDSPRPSSTAQAAPTRTLAVRMTWPGANRNVHPVGTDLAAGVTNYLIGSDSSQWRRGVQSFAKVRYPALYPGIDLVFYGNQEQLEYDFVVAPGGDPKNIRLRVGGGDALRIDAAGSLVIRAGSAEMVQRAPVVYQEHDGTRHLVAGRYVKTGRHEVRFAVGDYDRTRTLFIDPVLTFSSFFGGNGDNFAQAVAVDSAGSAYVTGYTASTNFPTTPGAYHTTASNPVSYYEVFVTKISATGVLMYSTYVGTSNTSEKGVGIAVDLAGNAYVTGSLYYPGSLETFPVVNGFTIDATGGGGFLFKLDSTGSSLLYSTLLRSGSSADGAGVAVVGSTAYVTGSVYGSNPSFPLWPTSGTYSTRIGPGGGWEAFVVKIDTSAVGLASLVYATRFGGSKLNYGNAIAVNPAGEAYVTGETESLDFPITQGAPQISCGGGPNYCNGREAFAAKLDASGTALLYSTYAGGINDDRGNAIAIDSSGNAYVAGETNSLDFPTTDGALNRTLGAAFSDGFVFKLNSTGTSFVYSTFLGGADADRAFAIAVDSGGNAYVAGDTYSADFPTVNAIQPLKASNNADAFVSKLNPTGSALVYSSYLGGTGNVSSGDKAFGIALDSARYVWVVGQTDSPDFPVKPGAIQTTHGGGQFDGFVVKIKTARRGDFNGDGRADLVWRNGTDGTSSIWMMNGINIGAGSGTASLQINTSFILAGSGDFDGDGKADLVWRNNTTGDTILWVMNGTDVVAGSGVFSNVPSPWQIAGVGDFNGDGKSDLLWRNTVTGENSIWLLNGTVVQPGSGTIVQISDTNWTVGGIGDFNHDGRSDILWRNNTTGSSSILMMNGTALGGDSGATQLQIGSGFRPAAVADLNGDGFADILWRNTTTGQNIVWLMNGTTIGVGSGDTLPIADTNWNVSATGDFNGDGREDLAWRNNTSGISSIWMMNGTSIGPGSGTLLDVAPPWVIAATK